MAKKRKRGGKLPRLQQEGCPVMVTFRAAGLVLSPEERSIVVDAFRHFDAKRYVLYAVTCMPDHAHCVLTPLPRSGGRTWSLSELMHSVKGYSAHRVNRLRGRTGSVWQEGSFDHVIRCEKDLRQKIQYIWENPARKGLVEDPSDYRFSWNMFLDSEDRQ